MIYGSEAQLVSFVVKILGQQLHVTTTRFQGLLCHLKTLKAKLIAWME